MKVPKGWNRDKILSALLNKGVEAFDPWSPTIVQKQYVKKKWGVDSNKFPNAIELADNIIAFPYYSWDTSGHIEKIIRIIKQVK